MGNRKVVLVTGVDGYWGAGVANRLLSEPEIQVIGIGEFATPGEIEGLDLVEVGVSNPLLSEFLIEEGVSTICHLESVSEGGDDKPTSSSYPDSTRRLLKAGSEAGVEKVVIMSSTAVYGALPDNPALITEEMPMRGDNYSRHLNNLLRLESAVQEFTEPNSQVSVMVLRFANIVGSSSSTPFTNYLKQMAPPKLIGFDPLMQMIHEGDVVEALACATLSPATGSFNIAAGGVMTLSRIFRILRKVPSLVFHPLVSGRFPHLYRDRCASDEKTPGGWKYLRYPVIASTAKMIEEMGFSPSISPADALLEFSGRQKKRGSEQEDDSEQDDATYLRQIIEDRKHRRATAASDDNIQ